MSDGIDPTPAHVLMKDRGRSAHDVQRRLEIGDIRERDVKRLARPAVVS